MSRLPHLLLTSVLALAAPAAVMAAPPGVNLRWDSCLSDGGVINKTFACDTNNGSERLVLSFVLDTQLADVSGMEIRVFIASATPTLPSWWSMKNAGTCRPTSLGLTGTLPPGAVNCVDWANGLAAGGLSSYNIGFFGPNTVFISGALAVPATALAVLGADQEYFAANLTINHAKTVGTACTGCNEPVCIVFDRLRLDTRSSQTIARYRGVRTALTANSPAGRTRRRRMSRSSTATARISAASPSSAACSPHPRGRAAPRGAR